MRKQTFTNELIYESSPYLLQHAHNPVNWMPWGPEALDKAKRENKPIIVSIGYAACHWCHVMEHESFEDTAVALIMNEKYVCIKVDREERPDIDQLYMDACQLIQNSGGWPLNAFAMPDGRPFYAGTYYPKENWVSLLNQLSRYYQEKPEDAELRASQITAGLNQMEQLVKVDNHNDLVQGLSQIWDNWKTKVDAEWGGQKGAPKFPMPIGLEYLLEEAILSNNLDARSAALLTLDKMHEGGIYDHLGGGFARYSVDGKWQVPHFEKMLYDNAQLVKLYSMAFKHTKNKQYEEVIRETIGFVERELMHKNGGFFSSLDADSEGEEGKFYVWSEEEFTSVLKEANIQKVDLLREYFNVSEKGNWEETNILWQQGTSRGEFVKKHGLAMDDWTEQILAAKKVLFEAREKRIRPGLDDKILCSWNAMMLEGLCEAYQATGEQHYLDLAVANCKFMKANWWEEGFIFRNYKYKGEQGEASIKGFLDDYAFTISALLKLYECTFEEHYLMDAKKWAYNALDFFFDNTTGMFFYTGTNNEKLVARKYELSDNVIPASNSVMAHNLFVLSAHYPSMGWGERAKQMVVNMKEQVVQNGPYYANWAKLLNRYSKNFYEVVILGSDAEKFRKELQKNLLPNIQLAGSQRESNLPLLENRYVEGQTLIYVCSRGVCQRPIESVQEALRQFNWE